MHTDHPFTEKQDVFQLPDFAAVPSKSQMTEYGPAAKSGNWNTSCFSVKG